MPKVILAESVVCMEYFKEGCVYGQAVVPLSLTEVIEG